MASRLLYRKTGIFDIALNLIMIVFCFTTLYPFFYLLMNSLAAQSIALDSFRIIPQKISLDAYVRVITDENIGIGFKNSILRTVMGTAATTLVTIAFAYPLSKKHFPHRSFWTAVVVFTMYFHGGLIPDYLLIKALKLYDTPWVLIVPNLMNIFHVLIVRNFFMSFSESLEDSARIDGANDIVILSLIIVPLSMPAIVTLMLWTAVWHWNEWFTAMIYIQDPKQQVIQNIMRNIVLEGTGKLINDLDHDLKIKPDNIKAATIMITTMPIIVLYPFAQKYFVKGVMIGSVKG